MNGQSRGLPIRWKCRPMNIGWCKQRGTRGNSGVCERWSFTCLRLRGALLSWIQWNLSFRYILFHAKKTPNDAVTPQRQSQFTPKMKANAVPRLLSSLVWIDQYNECNRITSFMEFMFGQKITALPLDEKLLYMTLMTWLRVIWITLVLLHNSCLCWAIILVDCL